MSIRDCFFYLVIAVIFIFSQNCLADNPIVQTVFTADPAPMVYKDTVYCYTSHDDDVLVDNFFTMRNWALFSTTDMVNWQSRGIVASLKNFSWAGSNGAWAAQCIPRDGKFYMYCPIHMKGIGVLVADDPAGPFTDPLKKPLLNNGNNDIDPTVFIDDDDQAYLYWGNPTCTYAKINNDMISLMGSRTALNMTVESFGKRSNTERPTSYEEGPWLYKHNKLYYLAFAGGPISEHLAYSTSTSPTGPWKYGGIIMSTFSGGAFTNHPGIIDYKGNYYLFYHSQQLSNDGFKRSVCVEKFSYNADGTISKISVTKDGAPQIGALNPYDTIQAETICYESGVETNPCSEGGIMVDSINNNDYIKVKGVDFSDGAKTFSARVASGASGGKIELRLGSQTGKLVGTCEIQGTGGWDKWITKTCDVSDVTGKQDLFFKFTGSSGFLFNFNWWKFTPLKVGIDTESKNSAVDRYAISVNNKMVTFKPDYSSSAHTNTVIQLFSLSGKLFFSTIQKSQIPSIVTMDLRAMKSGSYLIKVVSDQSTMAKIINLY
ncbi:MAG TPA: family 43 glycosylhydrolase [Chitinispirillaceae bacterium]|nr:family 43 glycosylhydrolase [Chitinispirillaceae bacterium]